VVRRRLSILAILATVANCALFTALAVASKPRLRLERVDIAHAEDGLVRLYASLVELEGQFDESKGAGDFTLLLDGRDVGTAEQLTPFSGVNEPLDLVLVIESSALYGPTAGPTAQSNAAPLERVKEAIKTLLSGLPVATRVLLIDYGGEVTPHPPFRTPDAVDDVIDELSPDDESGDLRLVDAVNAALTELGRKGNDHRRLVVVVSDGLNSQMDRRIFRMLGDTAERVHVPIHSIAFSATDERGPLVNLGELSKRSHGTFRWARSLDDLRAQVEMLVEELEKQYVLSFKVPPKVLEGAPHTYQLRLGQLTSNLFADGALAPRGRDWWRLLKWLLWSALGLIGAALLGLLALAIAGRRGGPRAELFILSGAQSGRRLVLSRKLVIGKRPGMLQLLDDPAVSGRHAMITRQAQGAAVVDLGSTNGTFINGRRIGAPTLLGDGDELRCGNTRLRIRLPQRPRAEVRT
jgi:hypothetical protein